MEPRETLERMKARLDECVELEERWGTVLNAPNASIPARAEASLVLENLVAGREMLEESFEAVRESIERFEESQRANVETSERLGESLSLMRERLEYHEQVLLKAQSEVPKPN